MEISTFSPLTVSFSTSAKPQKLNGEDPQPAPPGTGTQMSANKQTHMHTTGSRATPGSFENNASQIHKKENIAFEFERMFALQLVSEMTSGLFESTAEGPLSSPSVLHKSIINDTLASQLAREELFGFSAKIRELWSEYPSTPGRLPENTF